MGNSTEEIFKENSYANLDMKTTTATYTASPPTRKECIENITYYMGEYAKRKWYQTRKNFLDMAVYYAKELSNLNEKSNNKQNKER